MRLFFCKVAKSNLILLYLFAKNKTTIAVIAVIIPKILRFVTCSLNTINPIVAAIKTMETFMIAKTVESFQPVEV
jgi:hypothetical protein